MNKINTEVAQDLITLVNRMNGFKKNGGASFTGKKSNTTSYQWVLLDDILDEVKKDENFALMQPLGQDENGRPAIKNILYHKSGEVIESEWFVIHFNENDNNQNRGIAITYMRRYSLGAFLGIASETDNDGTVEEKTDEELAAEKAMKENAKYQKTITQIFETLVQTLGSKDQVYEKLGMNREQFLVDLQSNPKELLDQIQANVE